MTGLKTILKKDVHIRMETDPLITKITKITFSFTKNSVNLKKAILKRRLLRLIFLKLFFWFNFSLITEKSYCS